MRKSHGVKKQTGKDQKIGVRKIKGEGILANAAEKSLFLRRGDEDAYSGNQGYEQGQIVAAQTQPDVGCSFAKEQRVHEDCFCSAVG